MFTTIKFPLFSALVLFSVAGFSQYTATQSNAGPQNSAPQDARLESVPQYPGDAQLKLPEHYREWVYLASGFDMSYSPSTEVDRHTFDNVFVNPQAYKAFVETGTWPDKTMLVLEVRRAESKGSINQSGHFQGTEVIGLEVHVKDQSRFAGQWAFFGFGNGKTATMIPASANCYSCHTEHAAVDTTFVQFYPTLLPIAKSKGTLTSSYQKESDQK
jgi:hypothetical protein